MIFVVRIREHLFAVYLLHDVVMRAIKTMIFSVTVLLMVGMPTLPRRPAARTTRVIVVTTAPAYLDLY